MSSVASWLAEFGMQKYADKFIEHHIQIPHLQELDHPLLHEIGVFLVSDQKKILIQISKLKKKLLLQNEYKNNVASSKSHLAITPRSSSKNTLERPSHKDDFDSIHAILQGTTSKGSPIPKTPPPPALSPPIPSHPSTFPNNPQTPTTPTSSTFLENKVIISVRFASENGIAEQHKLDITNILSDGKEIRTKILRKFYIDPIRDSSVWSLFLGSEMTRALNDEDIVRICSKVLMDPHVPEMYLRKSFTSTYPKRNHQPQSDRTPILSAAPTPRHFSVPKGKERGSFFETQRMEDKRVSKRDSGQSKHNRLSSTSSKFTSFFSERPRDQTLADKLDMFFPEIQKLESQPEEEENEKDEEVPVIPPRQLRRNFHIHDGIPSSPILSNSVLKDKALKPPRSDSIRNSIIGGKPVAETSPIQRSSTVTPQGTDSKGLTRSDTTKLRTRVLSVVANNKRKSNAISIAIRKSKGGQIKTLLEDLPGSVESNETISAVEAKENITSFPVNTTDVPSDTTLTETSATTSMASTPPKINWTQGRLIGQGAFGRVYHALNLTTGEFMAVKQVLLPQTAATSEKSKHQEALERELELFRLSNLDHVNIVRYLGYEVEEGRLNLFLQYVSGGSISSLVSKVGSLDILVVRFFAFQILLGLEYLHGKNILHRDIKGGNVLVDVDGICKISDFGTSRKNDSAYVRVTRMSMAGTIPWMAPEVARGRGYSAKADIWSLGCLILEMMTGKPPWYKVQGQIIFLLGSGTSPPVPPTLPKLARDFIDLCFVIDPDQRKTAKDLLTHPFAAVDDEIRAFEFKEWVLAAEEKRRIELEAEESDDSSDYDDSDASDLGDMESEEES